MPVTFMDDLSITGPLTSTTPVKEVQSRQSSGGDHPQPRRRRAVHNPESPDEENELPQEDSPHSLDEQA
jgi:hypothetical protein